MISGAKVILACREVGKAEVAVLEILVEVSRRRWPKTTGHGGIRFVVFRIGQALQEKHFIDGKANSPVDKQHRLNVHAYPQLRLYNVIDI